MVVFGGPSHPEMDVYKDFCPTAMELQRGICTLCSESTKVLPSAQTEEISKHLPKILYENFLPDAEFQKIRTMIKICTICCYKIQAAAEINILIKSEKENESADTTESCNFCKTDKCLLKVEKTWKAFMNRAEGFFKLNDLPLCVCPKCSFYFDIIFNFKTKLLYKFPQLATLKKKTIETPQKTDTPKRKSLSNSPPSSKRRKIFDNCFAYLQPLCNSDYCVDRTLKQDQRLFRKIAYVNLKDVKNIDVKETPKTRPVIKIKLKPRPKKEEKEFDKLSKSEEVPSKIGKPKPKRRYSYIDKNETSEEQVDVTPKAATANLVPKCRVSTYIDDAAIEEQKEETKEDAAEEEKSEEKHESPKPSEENEENPKPSEEVKENTDVESNGIDKSGDQAEYVKEAVESQPVADTSEDTVNGKREENDNEELDQDDLEEPQIKFDLSETSSNSSRKSPAKTDSDASDTDTSDQKDKSMNSESDVLNGSERKKKRVTFSDEIND